MRSLLRTFRGSRHHSRFVCLFVLDFTRLQGSLDAKLEFTVHYIKSLIFKLLVCVKPYNYVATIAFGACCSQGTDLSFQGEFRLIGEGKVGCLPVSAVARARTTWRVQYTHNLANR